MTGLADAMLDSTPLVVISGQVGTGLLGTDAFQETNFIGITQAVTKWNCQVKRAEDIPEAIAKAFYIAKSGRPGPVVVDITKDAQVQKAPFSYEKICSIRSYDPSPEPDCSKIEEAAKLINLSKKPLVMVGRVLSLAGLNTNCWRSWTRAEYLPRPRCWGFRLSLLPIRKMWGCSACTETTALISRTRIATLS